MNKSEIILKFVRKDDREEFTLNSDKVTYSNAYMKKHYPKHFHFKYNKEAFRSSYFFAVGDK